MARDFFAIPATSVSVEQVLLKVWIQEELLDVNEPKPPRKKHGSAQ
jgi:hypothetical protein